MLATGPARAAGGSRKGSLTLTTLSRPPPGGGGRRRGRLQRLLGPRNSRSVSPHGQQQTKQKKRPYPAPARTSWGSEEGAGFSGQERHWRQRASWSERSRVRVEGRAKQWTAKVHDVKVRPLPPGPWSERPVGAISRRESTRFPRAATPWPPKNSSAFEPESISRSKFAQTSPDRCSWKPPQVENHQSSHDVTPQTFDNIASKA